MKDTGNRNTPGRYDILREEHARVLREGVPPTAGAEPVQPSPESEYDRWRRQTIARVERERSEREGPPPPSADPEFEKSLDERQQGYDALFKSEFGEDAERPAAWRNQERRILMKGLPGRDEAQTLATSAAASCINTKSGCATRSATMAPSLNPLRGRLFLFDCAARG